MHDQLDRPGPVRVRLRLNSELDQRLKTLAKTRGVGYTSLVRSLQAASFWESLRTPLTDTPSSQETTTRPQKRRSKRVAGGKKTVLVDYDGTMCIQSKGHQPADVLAPIGPVVRLVQKLLQAGHEVIVFTARASIKDP